MVCVSSPLTLRHHNSPETRTTAKKNYGARDISISPPGDDDASTVGPAAEVQRGGVLRMQGQLFAGPILLHTMGVNKNQ